MNTIQPSTQVLGFWKCPQSEPGLPALALGANFSHVQCQWCAGAGLGASAVTTLAVWNQPYPGGDSGKEPTCQCKRHETQLRSLGWEDPLEKGMTTHCGILAWRILWTEELGRLQFTVVAKSRTWLNWLSMHAQSLCHRNWWILQVTPLLAANCEHLPAHLCPELSPSLYLLKQLYFKFKE